ncbi:MAG TPA: hypothetical protein VFG54_12370 [Prolixibacteraceae bacterium]|nr:hypothetical protein [Prolixibacteraceae bacterium]
MTKLQQKQTQNIPAGIFSPGIEAFWHDDDKWVIAHGSVRRFHECDSSIQQPIWKAFMADKESLAYIAKMGIRKASEVFDTWYRCVIGGLDHVPDFDNDKLTPDVYNNMCGDFACPHRGRLCSRAAGLKNYEVQTLFALKSGDSLERTASFLCVSLPGMKSRVEKIKEKLEVPNMAALMARTAELGI